MDSKSRGLIKSLENWAKKITTGYRDVNIQNLSTSFRDGLAFCAIIHHYRPDLIDFESLSKENILHNNSTAFKVAEKNLGVPALLDAEDMVEYAHPDRLSIITYLSQLYNCFENQNKVSNLKSNLKRINHSDSTGPPLKLPVVQSSLLTAKRHEVCRVCKHRVYILERLIVDGKLYHTQCFKCSKCNSLLNPGAYVESDTPGLYECSVCPDDSMEHEYSSDSEPATPEVKVKSPSKLSSLSPKLQKDRNVSNPSPLLESVSRARNNFLQNSLSSQAKANDKTELPTEATNAKGDSIDLGASVKAKISAFESNQTPKSSSVFKSPFASETSISKLSASTVSNGDVSSAPSISPIPRERLSLLSSRSNSETITNHEIGVKDVVTKNTDSENILDKKLAKQLGEGHLPKKIVSNEEESNNNNQTKSVVDSSLVSGAVTSSAELKTADFDRSKLLTRPLSFTNEYKSPLKSPRDIFQTNIQPLRLTIQSANKRESSSLSAPPVNSPVDFRNVQIPQIRSTYSSLPRPGSYQGLESKDHSSMSLVSNSENNLSGQAHSVSSGTIYRRSSLGSKNDNVCTEDTSVNSARPKYFFRTQSSVELKANAISIHDLPETSVDSDISKHEVRQGDAKLSHDITTNFTPVPRARLSLEKKSKNSNLDLEVKSETSHGSEMKNDTDSICREDISESKSIKTNQVPKIGIRTSSPIKKSEEKEEDYPDDLNPFGSDDEANTNEEEYPDDLNPFGDDDEDNEKNTTKTGDDEYDDSKNPFASDEDEEELTPVKSSQFSGQLPTSADVSPFHSNSFSNISSPTGSLSGTARKRRAPKPPKLSDIFPNESMDSEVDRSLNSSISSPGLSKKNLQTPSPKVRKSKPAPPPPPSTPTIKQNSQSDQTASAKKAKELDNMKLKTSTLDSTSEKESSKQNKKKKRPAPPVPIPARKDMKKIPLKEIMQEMKEIEEKQREYERQGRDIELLIRDRDKDEEASVEEEEYIMQLFELVNQKNALFRRQAELMYIKRSQRLEEQQYEIDRQLRILMEKPESEKSAGDREREEELTMELIDIVDQRNSIIDSIEMDRRREIEEDVSVQVQLEIKNGDLPITAEIKEKSGKSKKAKTKKEKKKHQENGSSESSKKGTLKKKIFSKKQAS